MLIISFIRTALTKPGNIPNDDFWSLQVPENIPIDLESEFIALTVEKRQEDLGKNRNILIDNNFNETTCSSGTIVLIRCIIRYAFVCYK
jgi:hypothetical protein